jgi:hypothetical protein
LRRADATTLVAWHVEISRNRQAGSNWYR